MIEPTSERGKRLAALSARLRVLHTELADQDAELRSEQLRDEVKRATASMPVGEREAFLKGLLDQFPNWEGGVTVAAPVAAAPNPAAVEVRDPKVLAEKLIEAARSLSEPERAVISHKLAAAGFGVVKESGGGLPAGPMADFRKAMGLLPEAEVDPARVVEAAAILAVFMLKIEPWACTFWREVAPDAKVPIAPTLAKDLPRFVSGDPKVSKEAIGRSEYKLRSLVSLLMRSSIEAGKKFARDHLAKYSIEEIRKAAPKEMFKADEYRYWKQYERLMEGVDASNIEQRMKQVIAKDVDTGLAQIFGDR